MNKDNLFVWLDSTLEQTRHIDYLNNGGCAVYAVMMGKALKERGIVAKLRSYASGYGSGGDLAEAALACDNSGEYYHWHDQGVSFGHVFVEFTVDGETYWLDGRHGYYQADTEGQQLTACRSFCIDINGVISGSVEPEQMQALAENETNWNPRFSRTQGIPKLQLALGKHHWTGEIVDRDDY